MALKAYKADSSQAQYTSEEFSGLEKLVFNEGVLDLNGTSDDFEVTEADPAAMSVEIKTGAALVEYTKNGVTYKLIVVNNATITKGVDNNATGDIRVDAIVIHLTQDEPNTLKTNLVEVLVITGTGNTALSEGDLNTLVGDTNWYRLADINVPNGAVSIVDANIDDTRAETRLKFIPEDGVVFTEGDVTQTVTGDKTFTGETDFSGSYPTGPGPGTAPTEGTELVDKAYVDLTIDTSDPNLIQAEVAEDISGDATPKAVFISDGIDSADDEVMLERSIPNTNTPEEVEGVDWAAQPYRTGFETQITKVVLYMKEIGGSAGNYRLRMYATNEDEEPDGAALATSTVAANSIAFTLNHIYRLEFDFGGSIPVTPATNYVFVMDYIDGADPAHKFVWYKGGENSISGGHQRKTSSDSGVTWANQPDQHGMEIYGYEEQEEGKVYMSDLTHKCRGLIDGFIFNDYTDGEVASIRVGGVQDGFAG